MHNVAIQNFETELSCHIVTIIPLPSWKDTVLTGTVVGGDSKGLAGTEWPLDAALSRTVSLDAHRNLWGQASPGSGGSTDYQNHLVASKNLHLLPLSFHRKCHLLTGHALTLLKTMGFPRASARGPGDSAYYTDHVKRQISSLKS